MEEKHSSSFNSQIKIFENKAFVIDMENQLRCFSWRQEKSYGQ